MRLTKRTNIAIRVLMYCAAQPGGLVTKSEIAARCAVSESHLAQVINRLAQLGYLHTQRGRGGGIALARAPEKIGVGRVIRQFETRATPDECFADGDNSCPLVPACRLRPALEAALEAFYAKLEPMTLDLLVCGNTALLGIFQSPGCARAGAEERPELTHSVY